MPSDLPSFVYAGVLSADQKSCITFDSFSTSGEATSTLL